MHNQYLSSHKKCVDTLRILVNPFFHGAVSMRLHWHDATFETPIWVIFTEVQLAVTPDCAGYYLASIFHGRECSLKLSVVIVLWGVYRFTTEQAIFSVLFVLRNTIISFHSLQHYTLVFPKIGLLVTSECLCCHGALSKPELSTSQAL